MTSRRSPSSSSGSASPVGACPRPNLLALYVAGGLNPADPAEVAALEAHVAACAACADKLQAEAQLEVRLWSLGRALAARRAVAGPAPLWWEGARRRWPVPQGRKGRLALALTAAAAVVAAAVLPGSYGPSTVDEGLTAEGRAPRVERQPPARGRRCADGLYGEDCRPRGAQGTFVSYYGTLGSFPHPEVTAPLPWRRRHRAALDSFGVEPAGLWGEAQPAVLP